MKKKKKLEKNRKKELEDIGIIWDPHEQAWFESFNLTKLLKEKDPSISAIEEVEIKRWETKQKAIFKKGNLRKDREILLKSIGFDFEVYLDRVWLERCNQLRAIAKSGRDPNVSQKFSEYEGLGVWLNKQRNNYKKSRLPLYKVEQLEEIGIVWNVIEYEWNKNYEALCRLKIEGIDINQIKSNVPDLYVWIHNQKHRVKHKQNMSPDRLKKLVDLGIIFS